MLSTSWTPARLLATTLLVVLPGRVAAQETPAEEVDRVVLDSRGLRVRSADGRRSLRFGLRFQGRVTSHDHDEPAGSTPRPDSTDFRVRRSQLTLNVRWHPKAEVDLLADLTRDQDVLLDAVLRWHLDPTFRVWLGQFKHPISREAVGSIRDQVFVDWSLTNLAFTFQGLRTTPSTEIDDLLGHGVGRSPGLQLWGDLGERPEEAWNVRWFVNLSNARGLHEPRGGGGVATSWKLELHPFGDPGYAPGALGGPARPRLGVDVAYLRDPDVEAWDLDGSGAVTGLDRHDRHMTALGYVFKHRRFWSTAEYYRQWLRPVAPGLPRTGSFGWVAAASWLLGPSTWEVGVRVSRVDPDRGVTGNDRWERMVGVARYLDGHHQKISLDVARLVDGADPTAAEDRVRLQYQFAF